MKLCKQLYNGLEKRKYPRIKAAIAYSLEHQEADKISYSEDISAGGMCLIIKEKIEKDTVLSLSIKLPGGKYFNVKGKVVWGDYVDVLWSAKKCYELAIEFTQISPKDRKKIAEYIAKLLDKT